MLVCSEPSRISSHGDYGAVYLDEGDLLVPIVVHGGKTVGLFSVFGYLVAAVLSVAQ